MLLVRSRAPGGLEAILTAQVVRQGVAPFLADEVEDLLVERGVEVVGDQRGLAIEEGLVDALTGDAANLVARDEVRQVGVGGQGVHFEVIVDDDRVGGEPYNDGSVVDLLRQRMSADGRRGQPGEGQQQTEQASVPRGHETSSDFLWRAGGREPPARRAGYFRGL